MAVETELYDLLGVAPTATEADIKKAYRRKAMEHHPDKNPDNPEASQKFQEIAAAYEILMDADNRAAYDNYGMEGMSRGGPGGGPGMGMDDIFAQFFGGGAQFGFDFGGGGRRRPGKGEDTVVPYEVTLEDLYNGKSVKINMERDTLCELCKGSGAKGAAKPKKCAKCDGKGWTMVQTALGGNSYGTHRAACSECHGEGEKLREKDRCKKCKGEKVVKEKTRQEIHVERGMADKQRIVLAGAGDQEPGVPPGDVIFVLNTKPHPAFERSGTDLLAKIQITLSEALLGFSRILVTHLDGRGIHVASPSGKVIRPGDTIVLRGEGMPTYKRPDQKGDMYVVFEVEFPQDGWRQAVDTNALAAILPPKKADVEPRPAIVDDAEYEEADVANFGEGEGEDDEDAWEDEDDDGEPECRTQ